jgi:glutathione synthase/RimK-type ligase-like ATP-grasp enzyme
MRICILLPEHCKDAFASQFSQYVYENGKEANYDIHFVKSIDELRQNDLVLFRFGADYEGWKYETTEQTSIQISSLIQQIESKGCICFPNSYMMQFYENKVKLDVLFKNCNIRIPTTTIVNDLDMELLDTITQYPVIVKWAFSCSSNGIEQAYNKDELIEKLCLVLGRRKECAVIQTKILTRKEARISYFGNDIFHGYYRLRNTVEQVSAATRFGSYVDFSLDREKYRPLIESFIEKTGIIQGGIDIIWENDDESTEPYILEVSPIFDINPPLPQDWTGNYIDFKNSELFNEHWHRTLKSATKKFLEYAIKEYNKPRLYIDIDNTITNSRLRVLEHPSEFHLEKFYTQDAVYPSFVEFLHKHKNTHNIIFITARASYENSFLATQKWLLKNNLTHSGLIITHSLEDKIYLFKNIDPSIQYKWFDDCTHSHHLETPILDQEILQQVKDLTIPLIRIESESSWNGLDII